MREKRQRQETRDGRHEIKDNKERDIKESDSFVDGY